VSLRQARVRDIDGIVETSVQFMQTCIRLHLIRSEWMVRVWHWNVYNVALTGRLLAHFIGMNNKMCLYILDVAIDMFVFYQWCDKSVVTALVHFYIYLGYIPMERKRCRIKSQHLWSLQSIESDGNKPNFTNHRCHVFCKDCDATVKTFTSHNWKQ